MRNHWVLLLLLTAALLVARVPAAAAQDNCQTFRAITQAQAPSPYEGLNAPLLDVWGGSVFASLGAPGARKMPLPLIGVFSGADADDYANDERERKFGGMGLHGSYTFAFGEPTPEGMYPDSFTVTLGRAVWNMGPGQAVGDYEASGQITGGKGRFAGATGNLTIQGAFFVGLFPVGDAVLRWVPEINGMICGVK